MRNSKTNQTIFTNAKIVPMSGNSDDFEIIEDAVIVSDGDIIAWVGPEKNIPPKFKKFEELSKIFQLKGITKDSCILNYCGGGIAASLEAFVLYQLGFENITIYDNSLHEWAAVDQTLPMENN